MFPRSLIFFIIIIIIDIVSKSIKDKKKIEKAKSKKIRDLGKTIISTEENIETIGRRQIQREVRKNEPNPLEREGTFESKSMVGTTFPIESYQAVDKIQNVGKNIEKKKREHSNEKFKDDLLKGIIFSEILSKPKGLRNERKSI